MCTCRARGEKRRRLALPHAAHLRARHHGQGAEAGRQHCGCVAEPILVAVRGRRAAAKAFSVSTGSGGGRGRRDGAAHSSHHVAAAYAERLGGGRGQQSNPGSHPARGVLHSHLPHAGDLQRTAPLHAAQTLRANWLEKAPPGGRERAPTRTRPTSSCTPSRPAQWRKRSMSAEGQRQGGCGPKGCGKARAQTWRERDPLLRRPLGSVERAHRVEGPSKVLHITGAVQLVCLRGSQFTRGTLPRHAHRGRGRAAAGSRIPARAPVGSSCGWLRSEARATPAGKSRTRAPPAHTPAHRRRHAPARKIPPTAQSRRTWTNDATRRRMSSSIRHPASGGSGGGGPPLLNPAHHWSGHVRCVHPRACGPRAVPGRKAPPACASSAPRAPAAGARR